MPISPPMWCRRLPWSIVAAGRGFDGTGLPGHRSGRDAGRRRRPVFAPGRSCGAWSPSWRCSSPRCPVTGCWPAGAMRPSGLAGAVGGGVSVSADQRSAALDSLRADRLAALGVRQAGVCVGPGPLPDVSPQLSRVAGIARPVGDRRRPVVLVLKEPDLGTALVFLPVLLMMLFAAGPAAAFGAGDDGRGGAGAGAVVANEPRAAVADHGPSRADPSAAKSRATTPTICIRPSSCWRWADGSGSLRAGDATDDRSAYFVPEPHTDSIVCVLVERLGLWGLALLLALFVALVWRRTGRRPGNARTVRPAGGRSASPRCLAVQMLINTGMMVGLLPITGLALPLVSYGGSSLLANALAIGLC